MKSGTRISIVIPFFNEEKCVNWVLDELRQEHPDADIVAVDDGSTDSTRHAIASRKDIRPIFFSKRRGQSAALYAGMQAAKEEICVLMDGDGQCDPKDIHALVSAINNADFACGYRKERKDGFSRLFAARFANSTRRFILGDSARDTGAMKTIKKSHLAHIELFNGFHRYIPAFLSNAGLTMAEIEIRHRPRLSGKSKYSNAKRAILGIGDLIRVKKALSRKKRQIA